MRLVSKGEGTIIECDGALAELFLAQGWIDLDAKPEPVEVAPRRGRPKKSE